MIPKLIHQIWIGKNRIPSIWEESIESWKSKNKNYTYKLWNEEEISKIDSDDFLSLDIHPAYISDYFRYKILNIHGGFYFDVDFKCLIPIDDWEYDFSKLDFFAVDYGGIEQNGIMASSSGNEVSKILFSKIPKSRMKTGDTYGPWWLNKVLKENKDKLGESLKIEINSVKFLPEWYGLNIENTPRKDIYTGNTVLYSSWYPLKFCPITKIMNKEKINMKNLEFIDIGTSDFDYSILDKNCKDCFGLYIEPVKMYLDRIPEEKNVYKLQIAITEEEKEDYVYYVHPDIITKHNLPLWIKGCNTMSKIHPTTEKVLIKANLDINSTITKELVKCMTLHTLLFSLNVKSVKRLNIDVEGSDCMIVRQAVDIVNNTDIQIDQIKFETNELTSESVIRDTFDFLEENGWKAVSKGYNSVFKYNKKG